MKKFCQNKANLRLAQTALAIERYRLAHHSKLPAGLRDLVPICLPELPEDPFDGAPLRFLPRSSGGFTVYSVGPDGQDHGGKGAPSGRAHPGFGLLFSVLR